jgi:hypothetical protein
MNARPSAGKYGKSYYCIKTKLSKSGEIFVLADTARILPDGSLQFTRAKGAEEPPIVNLAIAPGHWTACYAASIIDGTPVAVEHWEGEVEREPVMT